MKKNKIKLLLVVLLILTIITTITYFVFTNNKDSESSLTQKKSTKSQIIKENDVDKSALADIANMGAAFEKEKFFFS